MPSHSRCRNHPTMSTNTVLVTGSSGLIGSEVCVYSRTRDSRSMASTTTSARSSSGRRATRAGTSSGSSASCRASCITSSTSATAQACCALVRELRPDADRPRRRAAVARSRRGHSVRRFRHQRRRHAEPARGGAPGLPRVARSSTCAPTRSTATRRTGSRWSSSRRAGTTPTRPTSTASPRRSPSTRSKHSLFGASKVAADVHGAGIRPLLRHADLLPARRLPDRAESTRRRAARLPQLPGEVQPRRARVHGFSATRASRSATTSIAGRRALHRRVRRDAPRRARSTTSAAARPTPARSSRRSRIAESFTGKPQRYTYVEQNRVGDHICYYSDLRKMRAHYPGWDITRRSSRRSREIVEAWQQASSRREDSDHRRCGFVGSTLVRDWREQGTATRSRRRRQFHPPGQRAESHGAATARRPRPACRHPLLASDFEACPASMP